MKWRRRPIEDIRTMEKLFTVAEEEAARAGETAPGAEYLVISALQLREGSARRSFERIGADPDAFRNAVMGQCEDTPISTDITSKRPVRYGASGRALFQEVVNLVREERSQIYGSYIVLVAAQIDHGAIRDILREIGVDRQELASAARTELDTLNEA